MNSKVTIIIPISRERYLDKLFMCLETLECNQNTTNLICIVDGPVELFLNVRNRVVQSKFNQKLCVQYVSNVQFKEHDINARRLRIADIHNQLKQHIGECDYVLGIEDDTIVPDYTLVELLRNYAERPYAGFIEGAELGRWGVYYLGAWKFDDVYNPTKVESYMPEGKIDELKEIDAGGLFCFMTKRSTYIDHFFKVFENNGLGPDVDFGVELRRLGYSNYLNLLINCSHMNNGQSISMPKMQPEKVGFDKVGDRWLYKKFVQ